MDIRVGGPPSIGSPAEKPGGRPGAVEARVLAVRRPRRPGPGPVPPHAERRESATNRDPSTGRVLILLIPDGGTLPDGIESGAYRVFLRFARR